MKYRGRLIALSLLLVITLIFGAHQYFIHGYTPYIKALVLLIPAWWIGKQFDKAKFLNQELQESKEELQQSKKELKSLFDNSALCLWSIDLISQKVTISKGIEVIAGYTEAEIEGNYELWISRIYPEDKERVYSQFQQLLTGIASKSECRLVRKDGKISWIKVFGNPIFNAAGHVVKLNGVAYDITDRKQLEEKLALLAYHDNLTGLPNRLLINEHLQKALARCKRNNYKLAVMFIDLDRFKLINDTMGHACGDELLKLVSERLVENVREEDIVARQGGDEFIILLEDIEIEQLRGVSDRIINSFQQPFKIENTEISTSPSIGISLYPDDGIDIDTLTKNSDTAMYSAKKRGRNNYQFYSQEEEMGSRRE